MSRKRDWLVPRSLRMKSGNSLFTHHTASLVLPPFFCCFGFIFHGPIHEGFANGCRNATLRTCCLCGRGGVGIRQSMLKLPTGWSFEKIHSILHMQGLLNGKPGIICVLIIEDWAGTRGMKELHFCRVFFLAS